MQIFLETERLVLRRFTADDLANLVALDSDPDVMRYLTGGPPTPREVLQNDYLPTYLRYYERYEGFGFWAAIEKSTGEFLGWFHFRPPEGGPLDEPELGYRLRKSAWGKGYGTEGSRALIRKGFTELDVRRVVASTYQHNLGSRRVMEKVGMTLVRSFHPTPADFAAHFPYDGAPQEVWDGDEVEYALEKADWEQQEAAAREWLPGNETPADRKASSAPRRATPPD